VESEQVLVHGCAHCGGSHVLARNTEISRKYTAVAAYVRCKETVREVVRCTNPTCGRTTTAPMPPMPCERSLFTCEFLAWLVVQRFVLLAPLDRIRRLLLSQRIPIAMGTLVGLVELAARLLDAIDGEHWKQLKSGATILTDGTGMKVLIEGQTTAWDGNLDVFSHGAVVVYQFALTKHGDEFAKLFTGFNGTVVCDAESRIDALFKDGTRRESNCNAHPRRKFRDAEGVQPVLARKAGQFLLAMYVLERKAKERGLVGDALLAWRRRRTRPIVDRFHAWLEQVEPTLLPSDPLGKAVRYYLRHFEPLTAFVDDARLPIDNNQSERLFQHHAKSRLNSMFAGSPEGAHRYATIAGIVASAQRNSLDVFAYLTWVFERRGTHRERFDMAASELTPAAYKKSLEQGAHQAA
jgi:transposase